jgi:hypothetical protein
LQFYSGTNNASGVIQKVMCADAENYFYKSQGSELFVVLRVYAKNIKQTADRILTNGSISFVQPDKGSECGAVVQGETLYVNWRGGGTFQQFITEFNFSRRRNIEPN